MAAGQISPWLLEAEALVNDEDEDCLFESRPTNNAAWAFEPARLLSPLPEVGQLEELNEALNDMIGDVDELEQVGMFSAAGSPERGQPEFSLGTDSLASTATSAQAKPFSAIAKSESAEELSSRELLRGNRGPAKGLYSDFNEYTIGDKVKYYSASRGEWLPAVVVEKKSKNVYVIDKQMKGCLAKVRCSELISGAEERDDPVLRALAHAFNAPDRPTSRAGTPRGRDGDQPRSRTGTPRRDGGSPRNDSDGCGRSPRGGNWQPPGQGATAAASSLKGEPLRRRKGEALGGLQKAPSIHAELPPALAALAGPASKSPKRGQIVRDDFSDDSEDD